MLDTGALKRLKSGGLELAKQTNLGEAALEADEQQQSLRRLNKQRLEQMRDYANTAQCQRAILLRYFGDNARD